ncbi:hypothetical protein HV824_01935 [Myxococcus sp. AM009]|uniref:hypothetical protein n=1 Tax=unclassified Myxococcus TaxID=2648731 RepID=UPI0015962FD8|nr:MULTISPECIES: hypothetical protein [unclassified Myxococcus]NVI96885.1 hypothetical protein [Myxococcus sp. AM009]NVJ13954.1 hypothetical protein [Myxococcus sp. AM010]
MHEQALQSRYWELLESVEAWAKGFGGRLVLGPPVPDEDIDLVPELLGLPSSNGRPVLPAGLREFWRRWAFARVEVRDWDDGGAWTPLPANFRVYSPDDVLEETRWVRIPSDVTRDNRPLSTTHLYALAAGDVLPRDAQWCVAASGSALTSPAIVLNHMGELTWARLQDSGQFVWEAQQAAQSATFTTFLDWFEHYVRHTCKLAPDALYPDGVTARPE